MVVRIPKIDDLLDDLEDVADLIHAARESSRPFEDFLTKLPQPGSRLR